MELSKAEVMRRLREAGFAPDAPPAEQLPIIPEAPPKITDLSHDGGDVAPVELAGVGPLADLFRPEAAPSRRRRVRDPNGEPWMVWIEQMWTDPAGTHIRLNAAQNQQTYRTEGYWTVGIVMPQILGPEDLLYAIERELSDLVKKSVRVSHLDGRAVA
jgi:hypothetical protein